MTKRFERFARYTYVNSLERKIDKKELCTREMFNESPANYIHVHGISQREILHRGAFTVSLIVILYFVLINKTY